MQDELVRKVAKLMQEQAAAYGCLEAATKHLAAALARGASDSIESLTRTGDSELLRMRSRLLQITAALNSFAESRAANAQNAPIGAEAKNEFETAAKDLLEAARSFQTISGRAGNLALSGSSFATACIQVCGVPPQTYRAPAIRGVLMEAR